MIKNRLTTIIVFFLVLLAFGVALLVFLAGGYLIHAETSRDIADTVKPDYGSIRAQVPGLVDVAKWSQGKAMMSVIANAIRTYAAGRGPNGRLPADNDFEALWLAREDFLGAYFTRDMFTFSVSALEPLRFTVTATNYDLKPAQITLNQER